MDWIVADLNASSAQWKIIVNHHPFARDTDDPSEYYYQQFVSRLRGAGADLVLSAHHHSFGWTYPLTGQVGGQATFVLTIPIRIMTREPD